MITTIEERERARRRLEQRSPETLAAFILTLIHEPHGVGAYFEAFIAADEPGHAVELIEAQIRALRRGETDYAWRHRRGEDFCARADLVLDATIHRLCRDHWSSGVRDEPHEGCHRRHPRGDAPQASRRYP